MKEEKLFLISVSPIERKLIIDSIALHIETLENEKTLSSTLQSNKNSLLVDLRSIKIRVSKDYPE